MAKLDYIPRDDERKAALFEQFRDSIGGYAAVLGLSAGQVASQAADSHYFRYVLNHSRSMQNSSSQWVSYKVNLLTGGDQAGTRPVMPGEPAAPPATVAPGILARFRALVRQIKAAPNYSEAMGRGLGLVGPESVAPDPALLAPVISLRLHGSDVEVVWNKGDMEAIEIQVDRGDGVFALLAVDTRPNYIDTEDFPVPAARWGYRAIYLRDAKRLGQWSGTAHITVGG